MIILTTLFLLYVAPVIAIFGLLAIPVAPYILFVLISGLLR